MFTALADVNMTVDDGQFCAVLRYDGKGLHFAAHANLTSAGLATYRRLYSGTPRDQGSASGRSILDRLGIADRQGEAIIGSLKSDDYADLRGVGEAEPA